MKDTPEWNRAIHKAKERDSDFLAEYVESRAIPWQFEFQNVKYRKTCSMDTVLMTLFLLRQRKMITEKAIKMASSPTESILQLIEKDCMRKQDIPTWNAFSHTERPDFKQQPRRETAPSTVHHQLWIWHLIVHCSFSMKRSQERSVQNANVQVVYRQERVNVNWVP